MSARWWTRIGAVGPAAGAIALVLAGLVIGFFNESAFKAGRRQSLTAQAEVLAATVQPALVFSDAGAAQELVSALGADDQVGVAAVFDGVGQRVALLARRGERPPMTVDGARAGHLRGAIEVVVPVVHERQTIGAVFLRTTPEPMNAFVQRHGGTALLLLTAMLVLSAAYAARRAEARAARESRRRVEELAGLNRQLEQQIERRETAEEALRQAQKMETLGQLTGGIAHDFNNLLQTVQGALDIIARHAADRARVERWAEIALQAAERGSRVTAQLLAFSRSQKLELRPISVHAAMAKLGELLPTALGAGVKVSFDIDGEDAMVVTDSTQLELAVLNLCINSRDAMPNGGDIVVSARIRPVEADPELKAGDYLLLAVSDNGVGMPEDIRGRAFDPFFTTKGLGKGTGLGLAQVYGIAKQAGGVARIASTAGQGTTVTIFLPLAEGVSAADDADERRANLVGVRQGARVLVVDDDAGVRSYICEALSDLGYDCQTADDGGAGVEMLRQARFDLLIVDFAMPGMTGAEVAAQALAIHPGLPILFASGYAESSMLEAAMGRPCEMLRKPFDTATLAERVAEALAGRAC